MKDNIPGFIGYHVSRTGNYKFKDIYPSVIKDYQNGMKVKDICDKYSIGHTTLNNYLRRFNIPRHT